MGRIATFIKALARIATVDTGGGFQKSAPQYAPSGDDSQPLQGDKCAILNVPGSARAVVVGYHDGAGGVASAGEKRIYSRDENGAVVASVFLRSSGAIEIVATGDVTINGVTISAAGEITAPSLVVAGKQIAGHTHSVTAAPGTTGPNL